MTKKRKIIWVAGIVVLAALAVAGYLFHRVNTYQRKVAALTFMPVDFSSIPDGTYRGESDVDLISAKVEVMMKNGDMTALRLVEHRHGRGHEAEPIVDAMLREQRLDVDTITGATNSCLVIRKAVENALTNKR